MQLDVNAALRGTGARPTVFGASRGRGLDNVMSQTYNEEAFRYFLALERKRSERSRRSFLLLLVNVKKQPGMSNRIPPAIAASLFSGLGLSVREVDFIGWFREERIAGAVLIQGAHSPENDASAGIGQRIIETLSESVPPEIARRLHVRVLQLRPPQESRQ